MYNFEALNDIDRKQMLDSIGVESVEELFSLIPVNAQMPGLDIDNGHSELEAQKHLKKLAEKNKTDYLNFLGGGAKKRFVPSVISDIASRFEFLSCYTPYQAEISQGTLRSMYEFQSAICTLVNQDVSNASVYDGATAAAEAILMAVRLTKKNKVFVSSDINPNYLEVIKTYLWAGNIELVAGENSNDSELCDFCARVYQTPNRFGELIDEPQKTSNELTIAIVDLVSLALFEPPNVDITVGDVQSFGLGLNFGGAYAGFIACKDKYKRQLPGRIAGKTVDKEGKEAYCLTLQAREQHIRREKATSNICSNQALCAFIANLYLRKMGKTGFVEIAQKSCDNAHYLAKNLETLGFELKNKEFFDEFTINVGSAHQFLGFMKQKGILAGLELNDSEILVSVSEMNDKEELDEYINAAKGLGLNRV